MGYTQDLLLIQLAHAKQAIDRARNNRYSDLKKQAYQASLFDLFEKVEAFVISKSGTFGDDSEIYDGPKKHLDFIFKSLEFLDNSTLNEIPYEIVECLTNAMGDWIDPSDNFIIVTSLINDVYGFSYEEKLAIDDKLYDDIHTKYGISFAYRLVQINLPRAFARDYLATVVLYHELGHFVDSKYSLISRLFYSLPEKISNGFTPAQLHELKGYLPSIFNNTDNPDYLEWPASKTEIYVNIRHLREYFCDLFAAQYIGNASNLYVSYLGENGSSYSESHPSAKSREKVVSDYQQGVPNIIVDLINSGLEAMGKAKLQKRSGDLCIGDLFMLLPPVISDKMQLHGILNSAWEVWLNNRAKMLDELNTSENQKCYTAINNLVEKSIGNYITVKEWEKACEELNEEDPFGKTKPGEEITGIEIGKPASGYLIKQDIVNLIKNNELYIRPLLTTGQIGEVGIDFRLGYDFLVSTQGREAFINASKNEWYEQGTHNNIRHFFQSTRRQLGETFILHPHQTVLAVTLEYVKLPEDCILKLVMRSSYARLGITINTIAQPGYVGCLNLELTNNNNNPINLAIGARIIQGMLYKTSKPSKYFHSPRKYICQVRPEPSAVINDKDLVILNKLWIQNNKL